LLASITSADIDEMIAYSNLEPWGALADDFRAGQICATLANVNRDTDRKREPFNAADFMPALARLMDAHREQEVIALDDPEAMSALIKAQIFGVAQ
jgi:hypothetical protein